MWNLPPYPPKDYVLRDVAEMQKDSSQFAPNDLPQVSQQNFGVYCYPVQYAEGEVPKHIELEPVAPYIMNKWTNELRAFWIDQPGRDDFHLHKMHRKYSINVDDYDARFKHGEKVFNRSYNYELECMEEKRQNKVRKKCARDFREYEDIFKTIEHQVLAKAPPPFEITPCKEKPPFWWECDKVEEDETAGTLPNFPKKPMDKRKNDKRSVVEDEALIWAEQPNLTEAVMDDPCLRRRHMLLVGQPFKSEACNWYYKNYPPPDIKFIPKKFV